MVNHTVPYVKRLIYKVDFDCKLEMQLFIDCLDRISRFDYPSIHSRPPSRMNCRPDCLVTALQPLAVCPRHAPHDTSGDLVSVQQSGVVLTHDMPFMNYDKSHLKRSSDSILRRCWSNLEVNQ